MDLEKDMSGPLIFQSNDVTQIGVSWKINDI